jgi:hypothetical protein
MGVESIQRKAELSYCITRATAAQKIVIAPGAQHAEHAIVRATKKEETE